MNRDFRDMLAAFCAEGVEFLLVGAYALAVHGIPRATGDIDLWIGTSASAPQPYRRRFRRPAGGRGFHPREDSVAPRSRSRRSSLS